MRSTTIIVFLLFVNTLVRSQDDWRLQVQDEWFLKFGISNLKIGDTMPDLPLGKVLNSIPGKNKLSDFKGKLIILDFWNTACKSCIAAFPKMVKLQEQFSDKIQIFLVNTSETEDEIKRKRNGKYISAAAAKLPASLPCIVRESPVSTMEEYYSSWLPKYFKIRGVPFHVWIDGSGIIRLTGGADNTYQEKIQTLLAGKEVFSKNDLSTTPSLLADNKMSPYYKFLSDFTSTSVQLASIFTTYNNEISTAISGEFIRDIVDSTARTIRSSLINVQLLDIYSSLLYPDITMGQFEKSHLLVGTSQPFVIMPKDLDTLSFTTLFWEEENRRNDFLQMLKDSVAVTSLYCYEQICPLNLSKERRKQYMIENVNRFLEQKYALKVRVEERTAPCYALVRTSDQDKIGSKNLKQEESLISFRKNGMKMTKVVNREFDNLGQLLNDNDAFAKFLLQNKRAFRPFLIINETGWENRKKVSFTWPDTAISSIEELRTILSEFDLDIQDKKQNFQFLVFEKVNQQLK